MATAALAGGAWVGCAGPLTPPPDAAAARRFTRPPTTDIAAELATNGTANGEAPPPPPRRPATPRPRLDEQASLADLIVHAIDHHPRVVAAVRAWRAAVDRLDDGDAFDPDLSVDQVRDDLRAERQADAERGGFEQDVPWPGMPGGGFGVSAGAEAWAPAVREAWYRLALARLEVTREVRSIVHELAAADEADALLAALVADLEAIERSRGERDGGGGDGEDGGQLELEAAITDLRQRRQAVLAMRPVLRTSLNDALGRPSFAPLPARIRPPALAVVPSVIALQATALVTSPTLAVLDQRLAAERHEAAVARSEDLPRFTLGVQGVFTTEPDDPNSPMATDEPTMVTFGISFPLWSAQDAAGVRGMLTRRLSITRDRIAAHARLTEDVQDAWSEHVAADRRATELETTLLPAARAAWREARDAFAAGSGTGTLADVLAAHAERRDLELALIRARARRGVALAALEEHLGRAVTTRPA